MVRLTLEELQWRVTALAKTPTESLHGTRRRVSGFTRGKTEVPIFPSKSRFPVDSSEDT